MVVSKGGLMKNDGLVNVCHQLTRARRLDYTHNPVTIIASLIIASLLMTLAGCASTPFPPHTTFIAEVFSIAKPSEIRDGINSYTEQIRPGEWLGQACGYGDANVPEGSAVILREFYYWHNQTSGIVRPGLYWAVADKVEVKEGNLVEVELIPEGSKENCPRIISVRGTSLEESQCEYLKNEKNGIGAALDTINPIGGAGSASIYCEDLGAEGWKKVIIGPYDAIVWSKSSAQ